MTLQAILPPAVPALTIVFTLLASACFAPSDPSPKTGCDAPNVVIYVVDTLRADGLACYGNAVVDTPATDRLGREGSVFDNAFAPSSWTRPSIASILTGLHPDSHGVARRTDSLADSMDLLSELFSRSGYATAAVLANPNVGSFYGFEQGFDTFIQLYKRREKGFINSYESVVPADEVIAEVDDWLDSVGCPFFLFVLTIDPHWPYQPPSDFDRYGPAYSGKIDEDPLAMIREILDDADRERARNLYRGEVAFADQAFGGLVDRLRREGRLDETIVVFTSDHGEEFWEHGSFTHGKTLFGEVLQVPLIIRYPPAVSVARIERPVGLVDIAPTLLTLAGIPAPYALDGTSLLESGDSKESIYAMLDLDEFKAKAIIDPPWKLVWDLGRRTRTLFNLDLDPGERFDVSSHHPAQVEALTAKLSSQSERYAARHDELMANTAAETVLDRELPEEALRALEALGYLEQRPAEQD